VAQALISIYEYIKYFCYVNQLKRFYQMKNIFFTALFSTLCLVQALAHSPVAPQPFGAPLAYQQNFVAIPNYLGQPFLFSDMVANLEKDTREVLLYISYDGSTWEKADSEAFEDLHRGSYQNTQLHLEIGDLGKILHKLKGDNQLHLKVTYQKGDLEYLLGVSSVAKKTLQNLYKEGKR
jgi:hypothetical protein